MFRWTENLGVVFGSRELKHFHDFLLFRERIIIVSWIASFSCSCFLLNVNNFEIIQFQELLNRKNRQLIDVRQRICKLFGICVLQINGKILFNRSILSLMFFFFFSRPCDQLLTQSLDHALNENRPSIFWVAVVTGLLRIFAVFLSKWQRERKKEIPKICCGKEKSFGRLCEIILSTKKKLTSSSATGRLRTSEIPIKRR